jgi:hypothetical protein
MRDAVCRNGFDLATDSVERRREMCICGRFWANSDVVALTPWDDVG